MASTERDRREGAVGAGVVGAGAVGLCGGTLLLVSLAFFIAALRGRIGTAVEKCRDVLDEINALLAFCGAAMPADVIPSDRVVDRPRLFISNTSN
jgi:hypothetical protein